MTLIIAKVLAQKGITKAELQRLTQIPKTTLKDIVNNKQLPRQKHLKKIAEALNVTIDDLYQK